IIKEKIQLVPRETVAARRKKVMAFLTAWQEAFNSGDRQAYLQYYKQEPKDAKRLWQGWNTIRTQWAAGGMPFRIGLKNMTLAQGDTCIVALFDEFVELGPHSARTGIKKVFLEPDQGSWKILGEQYQPEEMETSEMPILAALARLDGYRKDYKAVTDLIAQWAEAWSAKNIVRYRACYARDFYSKKMDLNAWIRYKKRLNKRYAWIKVTIKDLELSKDGDRIIATFLQKYESSANRSVGIKRLRLKRVGGAWKIYRETWHEI
ncbi:MAG: nuclear transport factor 2 family protein, partial [Deltaproteobacteria bacterium]|nr:nuclear transport factor 2 family protein [Deltaproteobacteria bacterium]